ncbi:MAG: hypothetical protein KAY24_00265 [Candidatus Eisenbacteria sp.]|nr:hypothetical protein [Candidatus Eisenbacteria bacterium]
MRLSQVYEKEELDQLVQDTWNKDDENAVLFIEQALAKCLVLYQRRRSLLKDLKAWRLITPSLPSEMSSPRAYIEAEKVLGIWAGEEAARQTECDKLSREMLATLGPVGKFPAGVWVAHNGYNFHLRRRQGNAGYALTIERVDEEKTGV